MLTDTALEKQRLNLPDKFLMKSLTLPRIILAQLVSIMLSFQRLMNSCTLLQESTESQLSLELRRISTPMIITPPLLEQAT
jgi:hypothetical protein